MTVLSDVSDLIMGQSPPSITYNKKGEGLPFFQGKSHFGFRYPTPQLYCRAPKKVAEPGDILISVRAPVGPANICLTRSCIGRGLAAIRPRGINGLFLYYNIRYIQNHIASLGTGSTFKAINKAQLSSIQVNEKGLAFDEQEKIATLLSHIEDAIEQQERLIVLTTELKKAIMHKLFTEGTSGVLQNQTEIGLVPENWVIDRVGNIARLTSGGTPNRKTPKYWKDGSIPWVKSGEVNYCIIHNTEEKITKSGIENSSAKIFPPGTLLMAMYGQGITRGKVAILGIEASTNQACIAFFPNEQVLPEFLYYLFEHRYDEIRDLGHGANQKNLSADILKTLLIAYPNTLDEQIDIIEVFRTIDKKIRKHRDTLNSYSALFRTLLHELMTAQVRVKDLDMSELNHEPIAVIREEAN